MRFSNPPIYLDNHATTPVDPRVFQAMTPYLTNVFGNASSATHAFGWQANAAVDVARQQVASLIRAKDLHEIVWMSGATESVNVALQGVAQAYASKGNHLITCVTEHRSVRDTAQYLESQGLKVTFLPVDAEGCVDPDDVRKAITDKTILISLMAANNEIGVLHPITEIGKIAREKGVLFHVDAAQACGKIPLDVEKMNIDLLSASAHKVYGPKGIGILYIRKNSKVSLSPILYGGRQEKGLRPGTLPVHDIVGMGKAFEVAGQEVVTESSKILKWREKLLIGLQDQVGGVFLNGHPTQRLPGNLNVSFEKISSDVLMMQVRELAFSSGSACASGSGEPSYVVLALGFGEERAKTSVRFGLGRFNTEEEVDRTIEILTKAIKTLRK